jgi:hypothetical protein
MHHRQELLLERLPEQSDLPLIGPRVVLDNGRDSSDAATSGSARTPLQAGQAGRFYASIHNGVTIE